MNETLRPSNFGEILDRTIQLYRTHFLVFFGIAAVPTAVLVFAQTGVHLTDLWAVHASTPTVRAFRATPIFAILLLGLPAYLAAIALASAAINHSAARALFGQKIAIDDAYKAVWAQTWRYIWLYLLQGFIVAGAPFIVWFVIVGISALVGNFLKKSGIAFDSFFAIEIFLALAALAIYCIWMVLRLSLAFPACIVEKLGAWLALKRSIALTNGTMGRIFLLYLLGSVLNCLLGLLIAIPVSIFANLISRTHDIVNQTSIYSLAVTWALLCGAFAVQALIKPVYGIALVLFYYDQRVRIEGFDIEWMMLRAGLVTPPEPQSQIALASDPETSPPAEPV
jgi:hypothetical protein